MRAVEVVAGVEQGGDAVVIRDELATLPRMIGLARHAHRVVRANLAFAAIVIVALVAWDVFGTLPLPLGVAGHEGSTILVGLNGLRLLHRRAWRRAARPVTRFAPNPAGRHHLTRQAARISHALRG